MSPGKQTTIEMPPARAWDADMIFKLFADSVRRRMLLAIARGGPQTTPALSGVAERVRDLAAKRLKTMRTNRILVATAGTDKRKRLWSLAPNVLLKSTSGGRVMDFGCLEVLLGNAAAGQRTGTGHEGAWTEDLVYSALGEPARRRLLLKLAQSPGQTAEQLKGKALFIDTTLKHLAVLRTAGLVQMTPNTADRRRNAYSITPALPKEATNDTVVLKFGFCTAKIGEGTSRPL